MKEIYLHTSQGRCKMQAEEVKLNLPNGLPAMRFFLHREMYGEKFEVTEYRSGRSVSRNEKNQGAATKADAIEQAERNFAEHKEKFISDYNTFKTVNR